MLKKLFLIIPCLCLSPFISHANPGEAASGLEPIESLNWVGCGISKKAYVTDLAQAFEKKTNIHINIQGGGATKGIRYVVSGDADLGGSCRYHLPENPLEAGAGFEPEHRQLPPLTRCAQGDFGRGWNRRYGCAA